MITQSSGYVFAGGHRLEYRRLDLSGSNRSMLVFLHEGLGSVSAWRDFPDALVAQADCAAILYSRSGHGASEPLRHPRGVGFMHDEASDVLPELLETLVVRRPILVGHSDGASIALIAAGSGSVPVRALILEAPHVFVEDCSIDSIRRIRELYATTDLRDRLHRHHGDNVDGAFHGWNDVWLDPAFRDWNIEEYLPRVSCPVLVIQGEGDEYGTVQQVESIATRVKGPVETTVLARCGHAPHRDQREAVLRLMTDFLARFA
jgi:pimeloyl-ACP methyl ester carboxylesterase